MASETKTESVVEAIRARVKAAGPNRVAKLSGVAVSTVYRFVDGADIQASNLERLTGAVGVRLELVVIAGAEGGGS